MQLIDILSEENIYIEKGISSKQELLEFIAGRYSGNDGQLKKKILRALEDREKVSTTGIGNGIAIPHAISKNVEELKAFVLINKSGVDYASLDKKPVYIFIVIFANIEDQKHYLSLLANAARIFSKKNLLKRILDLENAKGVLKAIKKVSEI